MQQQTDVKTFGKPSPPFKTGTTGVSSAIGEERWRHFIIIILVARARRSSFSRIQTLTDYDNSCSCEMDGGAHFHHLSLG